MPCRLHLRAERVHAEDAAQHVGNLTERRIGVRCLDQGGHQVFAALRGAAHPLQRGGVALVVVAAIGVVGFLVGATAAVSSDDGGEGACGYGEEDFELQRQVADELVAFVGAVDAD